MGINKRFSISSFEELYISQTFRKMTPVIFLHEGRFWHVMGLELAGSEEVDWFIYLKRYYYNRPATKLRIVTDSETGEQKYLLDHIKAMHID